jgi:hypothetical protein
MTHKYPLVAAAVAAAMTSGYAVAALPALSDAQSPTVSLVIAGSSAAASGIKSAIQTDLCGGAGNTLTITSTGSPANKNFFAYSCFTATDAPGSTGDTDVPAGTLITIYYRTEGGSIVGAIPVAANHNILRMNLNDGSCAVAGAVGTCTISGTTSQNGPSDSWGPATIEDGVGLGVTDVEPTQLIGADSPLPLPNGSAPAAVAFKTSAFGNPTPAQMKGLSTSPLYQQVFGLAVNTSGETFSSVNLDRATAANILLGNITDWSKATDFGTGNPIASSSAAITNVDREYGSGTRTGANIYFEEYCTGAGSPISNHTNLNYATSDELTAANGTPGSVAYTVIDQIQNPANQTKWTNLVLAKINGIAPSNLAAATGQYDYWFEATLVPNGAVLGASGAGSSQMRTLADQLMNTLPTLAKAPQSPAVNVIPGLDGNATAYPTPTANNTLGNTTTVYVSQFTRGGSSCAAPIEKY